MEKTVACELIDFADLLGEELRWMREMSVEIQVKNLAFVELLRDKSFATRGEMLG